MARTKKTPFPPWSTTKNNGIEQRYIRLGNSLLLNEAVLNLSHATFHILVYMYLESAGKKDFEFPYSKYKTIISKRGFQLALKELIDKGFIDVRVNRAHLRMPTIYSFSCRWREQIKQ
ncbi:hypothetical protein [Sinanaerobacter sp. ZZT-01]|uniref:hypothetical protein n=1 Tax=Sinanaerobacter sp. ZZT-01 TaxID=3111540 RepID=UPI002D7A085A|nr:hypothetical protein [Sinanaerobacter sp. ZZT-01]WRR92474.1 hypothetical protein U5921_10465 [Sinanaerobacter sp. ZZT-01]